jgi:hypothetical protein
MTYYFKPYLDRNFDLKDPDIFRKITLFVRDIPYGSIGSRNPEDILKSNMGTCSGKHFLLKDIYEYLGFEVKDMIAIHFFNNLPVKLSDELIELLNEGKIPDPHNFLKVKRLDKWIDIDITWDKELTGLGFEVNENWDGKSNMNICVVPEEILEMENSLVFKEKFTAELDKKTQKRRKKYITELSEYLGKYRDEQND